MGSSNRFSIPKSSKDVQEKMLNKSFQTGLTVEEAKAAMIAAAEPATTTRGGTRVPKFVQEESNRGVGGNVSVTVAEDGQAAPLVVHATQNEIPAAPAPKPQAQVRQETRALRFEAQLKLQRAGFRNGQTVDAIQCVKDGVLTHAEAEAILGRQIIIEQPATETEEAKLSLAPPVIPEPVLSDAVEPAPVDDERERVETKDFVGEIYKDGKLWIAEIKYKRGGGVEVFKAPSLKALTLKLTEGKGHGTMKVRETVQRYKLGNEYNTWEDFYKNILDEQGVTQADFNALPAGSQNLIYDNYQTVHIQQFLAMYPEYYPTDHNWTQISKFLKKKAVPISLHNLELVYKELTDDEVLDVRPAEQVVAPAPAAAASVSVPPVAPNTEDSVSATPPAAAAPAAQAAVAPQPAVRKRGVTGIIPGQSSAAPSAPVPTEDGNVQREPSVNELRTMNLKELRQRAIPALNRRSSR